MISDSLARLQSVFECVSCDSNSLQSLHHTAPFPTLFAFRFVWQRRRMKSEKPRPKQRQQVRRKMRNSGEFWMFSSNDIFRTRYSRFKGEPYDFAQDQSFLRQERSQRSSNWQRCLAREPERLQMMCMPCMCKQHGFYITISFARHFVLSCFDSIQIYIVHLAPLLSAYNFETRLPEFYML
jgi:hypothetical protein